MTAIVGTVQDGKVYIGADRAASSPQIVYDHGSPKVFRNGPFIMGYAGSFRFGQVLEHTFQAPPHPTNVPDMEYVCGHFMNAMRHVLKACGITDVTNGVDTSKGQALFGYNGVLYEMDWDFHVSPRPFAATGSGALVALGVLAHLDSWGGTEAQSPRWRLERALEVAENMTPFVRGPYDFVELEPDVRAEPPSLPKRIKFLGIPLPLRRQPGAPAR